VNAPGIYTARQVSGWRAVTNTVHARGGRIILQIQPATSRTAAGTSWTRSNGAITHIPIVALLPNLIGTQHTEYFPSTPDSSSSKPRPCPCAEGGVFSSRLEWRKIPWQGSADAPRRGSARENGSIRHAIETSAAA
jgi:hypothetical protein